MKLAVVWHKPCWPAADSPSGYAARGCLGDPGFGGLPDQVRVLSELFDSTRIVSPCSTTHDRAGEVPLAGKDVEVVPLDPLARSGFRSWAELPFWLLRDGGTLAREVRRADAVLAFVPSPVGWLGLVLALALRKPLLVRHLNPWWDLRPIWRLERALLGTIAGGRNVVFATGASMMRPSRRNPAIRWLFVTSLSEGDLAAARCDAMDPDRAGSPHRLITVTRDVDARATRRLLEALGILSAEWPQLVLDVVGDGPAVSECRRIAAELGVAGRVTFHGSVSRERLLSLLGEAALLCLVQDETEGSRQGLHEALARGLPVIAARTAAPPGLLEGCGTVVPAAARAFADAVRDCLADEAHRRQLSATALRVARFHSRERWCEAVRSALEAAWGPLGTVNRPGRRAARRTSEAFP